jgi:Alginate export
MQARGLRSHPSSFPKFKGEPKVQQALYAFVSASLRRLPLSISAVLFLFAIAGGRPLAAQDDITTQNATSGFNGVFITGPASNPLSFLNGAAGRTTGNLAPYDFHDFAPATYLDTKLPNWFDVQAEERFRYESYDNSNFKLGANDSYLLNRFRFQVDLHIPSWFRVTAQVQDARAGFQNPPIGPPNTVRWDLKLAYVEIGSPERHWFSLRVGRQLINYNNTIVANSEWRNQARSYDAAVLNLDAKREHLGIFAASAVVPQAFGVSPHQEGNNIYGAYGRIDDVVGAHSNLEPFFLWRVQPAEVVEPAVSKTTGKEDEKVLGVRLKEQVHTAFDYGGELIYEGGKVGSQSIDAWATQEGAAYQFLNAAAKPRVFAQYDYASGNGNPAQNKTHTTFDTIYPTAHDRFGITDLFGWQNIESVRAGITVEPHRRLTFTVQGLDFWAASALDSIYNTSGGSIMFNKTSHGRHVGAEIDGYSWYELNRHFNLGGGVGSFGGGQFLTNVSTSHSYTTYYIALNFKDNGKK